MSLQVQAAWALCLLWVIVVARSFISAFPGSSLVLEPSVPSSRSQSCWVAPQGLETRFCCCRARASHPGTCCLFSKRKLPCDSRHLTGWVPSSQAPVWQWPALFIARNMTVLRSMLWVVFVCFSRSWCYFFPGIYMLTSYPYKQACQLIGSSSQVCHNNLGISTRYILMWFHLITTVLWDR